MRRALARKMLATAAAAHLASVGRHTGPVLVRVNPVTWDALVADESPKGRYDVTCWDPRLGGPDRLCGVPIIQDASVPVGELAWQWP